MEFVVTQLGATVASVIESSVRSFLYEDEAVISGGASMDTKQELRDLESHINYASFLLAADVSDRERQPINDWISEARKTAFCLADQIDMYAIRSSSNSQLYDMKRDIGMLSIGELITSIKRLNTLLVDKEEGQMPNSDIGMLSVGELTTSIERLQTVDQEEGQLPKIVEQRRPEPEDMMRLAGMLPFIRRMPSVPADAIIKMDDKIKKIEAFLAGPHSVLFITGGQGEGKTTLMKDVYEQKKKDVHGTDKKCFFWVDIAESTGLGSLLKTVLEESKVDCDSIHEFQMIMMVRDTFKDKDCLIVLDNVKDKSVLYSLMIILKDLKWKIICLSRTKDIQHEPNQEVLLPSENREVLPLTGLEPYDSLKLLLSAAFCNSKSTNLQRENFQSTILQRENFNTVRDDVLREAITWKYSTFQSALQSDQMLKMVKLLNVVLSKCQDNPGNIWSIGRLLQVNRLENWEKIVERIDDMVIDRTKENEKRDTHIQLEDATLADAATRHCFLYCLAFSKPKTSESSETLESSVEIPAKKLLRLWTAEGFVQDSTSKSEEQEAEHLLSTLIMKNLLVKKKVDFDGRVLKCSVNEHIRPMAEKMCEQQKFCKFVEVDDVAVKKKSLSDRYGMTKCLPISRTRSILGRGWKKPVLADRYRMMAVHPDSEKEASRTHTVGSFPSVSWSKKKEVPRTLGLGTEIRLRSLLYFNAGRREHSKLDLSFGQTYMLLRTLELQGARLAKLSPDIKCLVCLRYLGLRNTQLEDLPPTWQSLRGLICLDIRDTNIAEVADVSQFREMRHLYLTNSFRSHSVAIRDGLHSLDNLQTLSGAAYGESSGNMSFEEQISRLRRLRKLSVKKASCTASSTSRNICQVISGIDSLESLAISCDRGGQQFDLSDLKVGKNLRKLKLGGPLLKFFNQDQLKQMQSITFLYLWDSKLTNDEDPLDPLRTLQGLESLLVLSLFNTSLSKVMICDGGYKKLKKLSIISMEDLSECTFGQNAMGKLEELVIAKCGRLKSLPLGLDQLGHLREVHLTEMHPDFCKEAKDKLGDKVHVLRDALSHVVSSRAAAGGGS